MDHADLSDAEKEEIRQRIRYTNASDTVATNLEEACAANSVIFPSPIGGNGVRATARITNDGKTIAVMFGDIHVYNHSTRRFIHSHMSFLCKINLESGKTVILYVQARDDRLIVPYDAMNFNNSCEDPNCRDNFQNTHNKRGLPIIVVTAESVINAGEELLFSYNGKNDGRGQYFFFGNVPQWDAVQLSCKCRIRQQGPACRRNFLQIDTGNYIGRDVAERLHATITRLNTGEALRTEIEAVLQDWRRQIIIHRNYEEQSFNVAQLLAIYDLYGHDLSDFNGILSSFPKYQGRLKAELNFHRDQIKKLLEEHGFSTSFIRPSSPSDEEEEEEEEEEEHEAGKAKSKRNVSSMQVSLKNFFRKYCNESKQALLAQIKEKHKLYEKDRRNKRKMVQTDLALEVLTLKAIIDRRKLSYTFAKDDWFPRRKSAKWMDALVEETFDGMWEEAEGAATTALAPRAAARTAAPAPPRRASAAPRAAARPAAGTAARRDSDDDLSGGAATAGVALRVAGRDSRVAALAASDASDRAARDAQSAALAERASRDANRAARVSAARDARRAAQAAREAAQAAREAAARTARVGRMTRSQMRLQRGSDSDSGGEFNLDGDMDRGELDQGGELDVVVDDEAVPMPVLAPAAQALLQEALELAAPAVAAPAVAVPAVAAPAVAVPAVASPAVAVPTARQLLERQLLEQCLELSGMTPEEVEAMIRN